MEIIREKERVKITGEVFTPTPIVNDVLDALPNELFKGTETFCDPMCGDGQFLVEVLKRKLSNGVTPSAAIKSIYGVDLMPDNIELCKTRLRNILMEHLNCEYFALPGNIKRTINKNIVCADTFAWDFEKWQPENADFYS